MGFFRNRGGQIQHSVFEFGKSHHGWPMALKPKSWCGFVAPDSIETTRWTKNPLRHARFTTTSWAVCLQRLKSAEESPLQANRNSCGICWQSIRMGGAQIREISPRLFKTNRYSRGWHDACASPRNPCDCGCAAAAPADTAAAVWPAGNTAVDDRRAGTRSRRIIGSVLNAHYSRHNHHFPSRANWASLRVLPA